MNIFKGGILKKEDILSQYLEEDVFSIVLGYKPEEGELLCSPLRKDLHPNCTFRYYNGYLQFVDFGNIYKNEFKKGSKKIAYDCFSFVQTYYKITDEQYLYNFILNALKEKNIQITPRNLERFYKKSDIKITYQIRPYLLWDIKYWTDQYGITLESLFEDKVFPIQNFTSVISNTTKYYDFFKLGYAYTEFESKNVKLYFPKNKLRFYTNCGNNDIGGINTIDYTQEYLIVTKSYKDYRVLRNLELNCIWFQNEGAFPDLEILLPLLNKFKNIYIFFDNDKTGIKVSEMLFDILSAYSLSTIYQIRLEDSDKDPSDLVKNKGQKELQKFLITNKIK